MTPATTDARGGGPPVGLSCRGVVAAPGDHPVLTGVDLEVPPGSLTVLAGPSGVGKSTLLRTVAGLQHPQEGTIHLGGEDITGTPTHRRGIAYVFQRPRLFPNLDVAANVAFPLRMAGVDAGVRRARAHELLAEVGLADLADRAVHGLSGGEAQRVALARALSGRPRLLLLDEPLASVDPERREGLRELVLALHRRVEVTTVYVTHDHAEAAELGDRIAFMHRGRILQHGPPPALFQRPSTPVVARFFGSTNILAGEVVDGRLRLATASIPVPGPDGRATFTIRPERVRVGVGVALRLRVATTTYRGSHVRVRLQGDGLTLAARTPVDEVPRAGETVAVTLPEEDLWRFPEPARPSGTTAAGVRGGGGGSTGRESADIGGVEAP